MTEDQDIQDSLSNPWTSIDLYYKGFHIKKSYPQNVNTVTLINEIDSYIKAGFEPSWNKETSTQQLDPIMKATEGQGKKQTCRICGAEADYKEGVSSKTGKKWSGVFCKANKDHVSWGTAQ